jgi:hypothetical protein
MLPVLVIALESRPRTYDYAKIYAVGLMNAFLINHKLLLLIRNQMFLERNTIIFLKLKY